MASAPAQLRRIVAFPEISIEDCGDLFAEFMHLGQEGDKTKDTSLSDSWFLSKLLGCPVSVYMRAILPSVGRLVQALIEDLNQIPLSEWTDRDSDRLAECRLMQRYLALHGVEFPGQDSFEAADVPNFKAGYIRVPDVCVVNFALQKRLHQCAARLRETMAAGGEWRQEFNDFWHVHFVSLSNKFKDGNAMFRTYVEEGDGTRVFGHAHCHYFLYGRTLGSVAPQYHRLKNNFRIYPYFWMGRMFVGDNPFTVEHVLRGLVSQLEGQPAGPQRAALPEDLSDN